MATAREQLLQALTAIISQPISDEGLVYLRRLLNSYRVQAKPGETIDKNKTARDCLAESIVKCWKENKSLERRSLNKLILPYRMQQKQGLSRVRHLETKPSGLQGGPAQILDHRGLSRSQIKEQITRHENAYFKDKNSNSPNVDLQEPIAGGPSRKTSSRGQCPKCRSMGIVLAKAYGGEDYYTCIYCGFQAYRKENDAKFDLPLAAELLGGALSEPELDEDE